MMTYKVLTIITFTLLTVSAKDKRRLIPKLSTNQRQPEPRSNRQATPKNFNYDQNPYHSTSGPIEPAELDPNTYQTLQYAPLHGRSYHKNKNAAAEYTKVTPTSSSPSRPTEVFHTKGRAKAHLEPRVQSAQVPDPMKCYNPGHKIELYSSVSRSPGHNAVYRDFPEPIPGDQLKDYLNPFGYPNVYSLTTTMMPFDLPETVAKPFSIPNQHYVLNPNNVDSGPDVEKIKRQYLRYAKLHRLHLNIARVYNPGQVPPKSPAFADTYSLNLGSLPVHSQAYIQPVYQVLPIQKTVLYPVKNNQKIFHVRMPENRS